MKRYLLIVLMFIAVPSFAQVAATKNIASLKWSLPTQRENGKTLSVSEIAGYEITYKAATSQAINKIVLVGGSNSSYDLDLPTLDAYDIYISAYDTKGLLSAGLKVTYSPETSPPKMKDGSVSQKWIDPQTTCTVELLCKIVKF